MGLFSKKTNNTGNLSPQEFYNLCVKDYHENAQKLGYAKRGLIFIPELIALGQQAVLWFLRNDDLKSHFTSPSMYYFVGLNTAVRCGILFGLKWHLDFNGLNVPGYVESVMEQGPSVFTDDIIKNDLGMDEQAFNSFCTKLFDRWCALHDPYWKLSKPAEYTIYATLAAYQLGISMILCKYGFGK